MAIKVPKIAFTKNQLGSSAITLLMLLTIIYINMIFLQKLFYFQTRLNKFTATNSKESRKDLEKLSRELNQNNWSFSNSTGHGKLGDIIVVENLTSSPVRRLVFKKNAGFQFNWRLYRMHADEIIPSKDFYLDLYKTKNINLFKNTLFTRYETYIENSLLIESNTDYLYIVVLGSIFIKNLDFSFSSPSKTAKHIILVASESLEISAINLRSINDSELNNLIILSFSEIKIDFPVKIPACRCRELPTSCVWINKNGTLNSSQFRTTSEYPHCESLITHDFFEKDEIVGSFVIK